MKKYPIAVRKILFKAPFDTAKNRKFLFKQSKGKLVDFIMFLTNELVKRGLLEHLQQVKKRKGIIYPSKRKTKRKFSKKQLAAQRLFAKRARAGTLRMRKR